jgi:hypothetical protein
MFLLNIKAGREILEGDEVVVRTGPRAGSSGIVVGFSVYSPRPVVVQYRATKGLLRETFAANEVEVNTYTTAPGVLEPLPETHKMLVELSGGAWQDRGKWTEIRTGRNMWCLFPAAPAEFKHLCESEHHHYDDIIGLVGVCFVTRLPHLVR